MIEIYAWRALATNCLSSHSIEEVIYYLLTENATAGKAKAASSSMIEEKDDRGESSEAHRALPLIVAHLHADDYNTVLNAAPTPEIREAWLKGLPTAGAVRRLLLERSDATMAAQDKPEPSKDSHSVVEEKMYEEGRQYWRGVIDV